VQHAALTGGIDDLYAWRRYIDAWRGSNDGAQAIRIRHKTYRLIASKYPTVGVFDDLASDPGDLRAAFILEALTNDRLSAQGINLLPDEEIIAEPVDSGASIVMAAFLHADEAEGDLRWSPRRVVCGMWT